MRGPPSTRERFLPSVVLVVCAMTAHGHALAPRRARKLSRAAPCGPAHHRPPAPALQLLLRPLPVAWSVRLPLASSLLPCSPSCSTHWLAAGDQAHKFHFAEARPHRQHCPCCGPATLPPRCQPLPLLPLTSPLRCPADRALRRDHGAPVRLGAGRAGRPEPGDLRRRRLQGARRGRGAPAAAGLGHAPCAAAGCAQRAAAVPAPCARCAGHPAGTTAQRNNNQHTLQPLPPQEAKKNALKASGATWLAGSGLLAYNGYNEKARGEGRGRLRTAPGGAGGAAPQVPKPSAAGAANNRLSSRPTAPWPMHAGRPEAGAHVRRCGGARPAGRAVPVARLRREGEVGEQGGGLGGAGGLAGEPGRCNRCPPARASAAGAGRACGQPCKACPCSQAQEFFKKKDED